MVLLAFAVGAIVVMFALPLQKISNNFFSGDKLILIWVIIEETLKYLIALTVILWRKVVDEPIDVVIYMIAVARFFCFGECSIFN